MAKAPVKTAEKPAVKKIVTPVFRLSYPNLFRPRKASNDPGTEPKFSCSAIWEPATFSASDKARWKELLTVMDSAAKQTFGKVLKDLPEGVRRGLRDGASKEGMEGYGPGKVFASLTSLKQPEVVDRDRMTISVEEGNTGEIYPGAFCRATVSVYTYNNKGKGVALGLRNLQKVKDGPRIDGGTRAADDFEGEDLDAQWDDSDEGLGAEAVGAADEKDDEIPF